MNIRLLKLTLNNFKGVKSFALELDAQSAAVRGSNGVGKTTLYDAYCWLLFGKDSAGRSDSAFDVKPYGEANSISTVTGEFDAGEPGIVSLSRRLAEKTVRQRGTDEVIIKNEYSFSIDGVPKTKTQYDKFISELCPPNYFRMVSDPDFFAGKLKWDERRSVLTRLFGDVEESELLLNNPEYGLLQSATQGRSVADYKALIAGERKKVKAELDAIPDRISEAELAIPAEAAETDPLYIQRLEEDLRGLRRRRADAANNVEEAQLKRRLAESEAILAQSKTEYLDICAAEGGKERDALSAARNEHGELVAQKQDAERKMNSLHRALEDETQALERLRKEYADIDALMWDSGAQICPHCHQSLPADKIVQLREDFNLKKSESLQANIKAGQEKSLAVERIKNEIAELAENAKALDKKIAEARELVDSAAARVKTPAAFETTEAYKQKAAAIDTVRAELNAVADRTRESFDEFDANIAGLQEKINAEQEKAASAQLAERQRIRISALKERVRELGKRAAKLDKMLDMAARFEQYKLSAIEENVNSKFKYAKFRLFDRQLNGGYSECCEVVVDDAPYSTNLNPGKKINAGLDIVATLSEAVGFSAPVWIDNSESYVKLLDIGAQLIQLRVDADAQTLAVEILKEE